MFDKVKNYARPGNRKIMNFVMKSCIQNLSNAT